MQHDQGLFTYQDYVGAVARHVAVDIEAAAAAIARLAGDPALRQRMGEAGSQTVCQRFDWPVVARLHHQLYAELAELRRGGRGFPEWRICIRCDLIPSAIFCLVCYFLLGSETELRLAMPLPELQHRLNDLTSLDRCYGELHASPADVQRLLEQLHSEGDQPCHLMHLLRAWPDEQHDALRLSLTWLAKLGCIQWSNSLGSAMTQAENPYQQEVFLEDLRQQKDFQQQRIWAEHQQMQLSFLQRRGFTSSSTVLDIGCGPMRLGSALIPLLNDGWYYGQDINPSTIAFGEEVLRESGIPKQASYTLFASDQFEFTPVDRPVQIAFANSVFSHLTLNSILTALLQLQTVLAPSGALYATFFALEPGRSWLEPHPRNKWGHEFETYPPAGSLSLPLFPVAGSGMPGRVSPGSD